MINENIHHKNEHTLYLAETGHGKSSCMKKCSGIPGKGARVVLYDPNRDHPAHRFDNLPGFFRALARGHASGRGFRISYTGRCSIPTFEKICAAILTILDGNKRTYIVLEEYGRVSRPFPINPDQCPAHFDLWTQSRKYGGVIHAASQRPQNISKDALENAGRIYAGGMGSKAAKSVNAETDIPTDAIKGLKVGNFIEWQRGQGYREIRVF